MANVVPPEIMVISSDSSSDSHSEIDDHGPDLNEDDGLPVNRVGVEPFRPGFMKILTESQAKGNQPLVISITSSSQMLLLPLLYMYYNYNPSNFHVPAHTFIFCSDVA